MQVLVIGGTRYVGRFIVEELLDQGHDVTLFHRGRTNTELFGDLERVLGDRVTDIGRLGDRDWDVVIDTCGYEPAEVAPAVEHLADRTERYVFISSVAVHEPTVHPGITEDSPVQRGTEPDDPVAWWHDAYARDKVACEDLVLGTFGPERTLVLRPGMLVGPHDPVWYLPTLVARFRFGGRVLVPAVADQPVQVLDCRDLGSFAGRMVDAGTVGTFLVDGPPVTHGEILQAVAAAVGTPLEFVAADESWLLARPEVDAPWERFPYWLPGEEALGYGGIDVSKALEQGLTPRPLTSTVQDVAAWYDAAGFAVREDWTRGHPPQRGLSSDDEARMLADWAAR